MWNVPAWLTFQLCECFSKFSQNRGLLLQLLHRHQLVVDRRLLLDLVHRFLQVTRKEWTDGWTSGVSLLKSYCSSQRCNLDFSKTSANKLSLKPQAARLTVLDSWSGGVWTDISKFHATTIGRSEAEAHANVTLFSVRLVCSDSRHINLH